MTDDEIRRDVLANAGWEPDEIDRWPAAHRKPTMLGEQTAIFGERVRDVGRAVRRGFIATLNAKSAPPGPKS